MYKFRDYFYQCSAILFAVTLITFTTLPKIVQAGGIPSTWVYTPCVQWSTGEARSDLVSDYPGPTVDEIYWADVTPMYSSGGVWQQPGTESSGWQFDQAVAFSVFGGAGNGFVWSSVAYGNFWAWNYPLQIYITFPTLDDFMYC